MYTFPYLFSCGLLNAQSVGTNSFRISSRINNYSRVRDISAHHNETVAEMLRQLVVPGSIRTTLEHL
jgi:hypothetical protein